jgi:hypothetical protein
MKATVVLAVGAAVVVVPLSLVPAAASQPGAVERAPECVTVRAVNPDASTVLLELCGSGPGRESPLQGWAAGRRVIVDGAFLRGDGCGGLADPCVMFAIRSPAS